MNKIANELIKIAKELRAGSLKYYVINGNFVTIKYENYLNGDSFLQSQMEDAFRDFINELKFAKSKFREIGLVSGTINPPRYEPSSNKITTTIQFRMAQPVDVIVESLRHEGVNPL